MIFKSLYIQGFKSFVDKTLIEFPLGITAIVGPNGSGKSNIMDSLRWVFGEQRASELRGGEMGDVIFAGSEKRRPAGFAEVGLTLSDLSPEIANKWGTFQDITVTRKIYRTGEREYFINGRKCRLKDIKDIFFDTGLGARSISIIEQERVTKIVNSSPEELRYFLEETAGVIRYKERKKEAETRLKQTRENLNRIDDILAVLAGDMHRLSVQVEQVRKYRELRDQKGAFEKAFFCVVYAQYVKEKNELESKLESSREVAAEVVSKHQAQIDEETALQRQRAALVEKLNTLRTEYDKHKDLLAAAEGDIRQYEANIASAEQQKQQLHIDIASAKARIDEMNKRMLELSESIQDTFDLVSDFEDRVEEYNAEIADTKAMQERSQDEMKRHNKRYLEISQRHAEFNNKINLANAALANHQATTARLLKEQQEMLDEGGSLDKRIADSKAQAEELEAGKNQLAKEQSELIREAEEKEAELGIAEKNHAEIGVALNTSRNQLEFLRSEIDSRMSKGGDSFVSEFNGRAYSEIVELTEEAYLQYADLYVFPDDIKESLLNRLIDEDISLKFIFEADIARLGEEVPLKLVNGQLYQQGVIYRNIGGDDPALALLNLQKTLEQEQLKVQELSEKQAASQEVIAGLQALHDELENKIDELSAKLQQSELDYNSVKSQLGHLEDLKNKMQRNVSVIDKELELSRREVAAAEQEIAQLEEKQAQVDAAMEKADEERLMLEEKAENITNRLEDLREEHAAATRELARYTERKSALQTEKAQLTKDKTEAQQAQDALVERLTKLEKVQVIEWNELLDAAKERKNDYTKSSLTLSENIKETDREQFGADERLAILRSELAKLNDTLHSMDIANAEYTNKLETINTNMSEIYIQVQALYNADINLIYKDIAKDAPTKAKIQELISRTEAQINELGPLNMAAEDEYEEKSAQFQKQTEQKTDIENAIDDLTALIGEIDDSTAQLFSDTFKAVRENFIEVFTRFFGSGSADLRLTDPENMLTTGVELFINPPGKKVSNKNLLSGGEKALAALTLLFALFLQKPTPFCFLDEVDAPLDDANAGRFISMVRSLSEQTQFVIITHKHQTMAAADSLYGVTMQEGGVSTMLSVELA